MANKNFIVQNGLQVGPLTIDAATGSISTSGTVNIQGGLATSSITKNDSSLSINDTGTGSSVVINIDGVTEHTIDSNGVNLASGDYYAINGASVLSATTLGSGVTASSLTSVGTLTGLTVSGATQTAAITSSGTIIASTVNAGTIGNTGATLTGTLSTAAQPNVTSLGTIASLVATTAVATNFSSGNAVITGGSINNVTVGATTATTGRFTTLTATTVNAGTIGNTGATLTGTLSTAAQPNITSLGTLTSLAVGAVTSSGTIIASTLQAGTIGNTGATLTGTLSTAAQTNITSVGTLTGLTVSGSGAFGGNLNVSGNLNVTGSLTTYSANNVSLADSLIYLADGNNANVLDIGFVGAFTNASYQHTGFVRDASDNTWKLFSNVIPEPTTTVDFTNAVYDPVRMGAITAPSATLTGTVIATTVNAGTIGNTGATLTGTISTAAQPNITSVGTLTSLAVGAVTSSGTIIASTVNAGTIGNTGATLTGTLSTAAQTNVTSVGTLTGLTVSGAIVPNANVSVNLGSTTAWWNTIYGRATQAQYADLAENYQADSNYSYGTVVMFGGSKEVTLADADTTRVAGVVSQNPAHLMNGGLTGANVVPLALQGRVPCNVIGPVRKGDMMVSAGFGYAKASTNPMVGQVIGKALSDFDGAKGQIEVVVGRV